MMFQCFIRGLEGQYWSRFGYEASTTIDIDHAAACRVALTVNPPLETKGFP